MQCRGILWITALVLTSGSPAARATTYTSQICGSGSNNIPDATGDGSGNITPGSLSCIITVNDTGSVASGNAVAVSLLGLQHEASGDLIVTLTHFMDAGQSSMYGSPQRVFYRIGKISADPNDFGYSAQFGDPAGTGDNYDFNSAFPGDLWATAAALGAANLIPGRAQGSTDGYWTTGPFSSAATTFSAMFAGQPLAGVWRLDITDNAPGPTIGSTGSLLQWQLTVMSSLPASLNIIKIHAGNFTQGQQNATCAVTVSNAANAGPTTGTVTVTETVPPGLMLVSMAGNGWTCQANTCNRSDALNGGANYPAITVTVSVAPNAGSPQVNSVAVSGGGSQNANTTDSTNITANLPVLSIAKTHTGSFTQAQQNATYAVTVSNTANAGPTSGTVTVTETTPPGLTLVSMAGTGWTCPANGNTCTRSDALNGGASYQAITVTVNVAANAGSPQGNAVAVSGGGSANASTTDSTVVNPFSSPPQASKPGIFRQGFLWVLDANGNHAIDGSGPGQDYIFGFGGLAGDIPIYGDWNGDGHTKVGFVRNGNQFFLDYNGNRLFDGPTVDRVYTFGGLPGDIPVIGDWNGDGKSKIGIYRNGVWILDLNGNGVEDPAETAAAFGFGGFPGDVPIVGDWTGSGIGKPGIFRQGFLWILDTNGNHTIDAGDAIFPYGGIAADLPVVGDWTGTGVTQVGILRQGFLWVLDANGNRAMDEDSTFIFPFGGFPGPPADKPVVGKW